ncbi:hypothetical protein L917_08450, partial [Phytophthora nicotianae]
MNEWISKIWRPSVTGRRMLLLDSLKVHKKASIRETLETECTTQVQYIPSGCYCPMSANGCQRNADLQKEYR